jgi:hypothetical protein
MSEDVLGSIHRMAADMLARSSEANPHVLAHRALKKMTPDQVEVCAVKGAEEIFGERLRFARSERTFQVGRSRRVVALEASRDRRSLERGWDMLAGCNLDDLNGMIEKYDQRIERLDARRREIVELRDNLEASGFQTVGEMLDSMGRAA